jgi:hypothetical protein
LSVSGGYVRVYRKLSSDPIWNRMAPAVTKVMIGFLLKANYQPTTWYDGKDEIQIPRGSFITTAPMMAKFCNVSLKQSRAAFDHLERAKFATLTRAYGRAGGRAGGMTMVTICNYDLYQSPEVEEGTRLGTRLGLREGSKVIKKNINTPPTPSDEVEEASPLADKDSTINPHVAGAAKTVHQATLSAVAASIHGRHPGPRRDCGVGMVGKKLEAILKYKHIPVADRVDYLLRVEANHASMCATGQWQRDGGEFAKALTNYLAPTQERYDIEATAAKSDTERIDKSPYRTLEELGL